MTGRARCVSGTISTDDILPARHKHSTVKPGELATHVFEHLLPGFAGSVQRGDLLVCRGTLGIGSSREQAVSALQAAGIEAFFAARFGRIFFRNAWNLGVPAIELAALDIDGGPQEGDAIEFDLGRGTCSWPGGSGRFPPVPPMLRDMVARGGLLAGISPP